MKDFAGNEINIGDIVAATESHYNCLIKGKVVKITPKMLIIESLFKDRYFKHPFKRFPYQVVVIKN